MQPSEEIKSRLDIVDVLRDYIQLHQAGSNFKARCPFHNEKTPSLMVSPEKQIWHCFGCGKGGDIFSFIQEYEGISFVDALKLLAPKAGVVLQKQDAKNSSQRIRVLQILELSRKYYHKVLTDSRVAESARKYLIKRGLTDEVIEEWQIGYSPDSWDDLIKILKERGYNDKEIFLSGMSISKEGTSRFYNRFRGRIMFPINDVNANTVGFSARISPEKEQGEVMGKYINSPQTLVYDKSKILFGLDKSKVSIKNSDLAIIVEGQMDVITAHQNGFRNVVASSGTALTQEQIKLIKRFTNNISLAFDVDTAGVAAAERGIKEALQAGMSIKVIEVPKGKDPDECIRENPTEWKSAVDRAKYMMDYYLEKIFSNLNPTDVRDMGIAANKIFPIILMLNNKIEQDFWISKFSQIINRNEESVREMLNFYAKNSTKKTPTVNSEKHVEKKNNQLSREEYLSEILLSFLLNYPFFIEYSLNNIQLEQIIGETNKNLYKKIIFYYNYINNILVSELDNGSNFDFNQFKNWLNNDPEIKNRNEIQNQLNALDRLVLLIDKEFGQFNSEIEIKNEIVGIVQGLKKNNILNRMRKIEREIYLLEKNNSGVNEERILSLMEEMKILSEDLKR